MWQTPLSIVSAWKDDAARLELGAGGRDVLDVQGVEHHTFAWDETGGVSGAASDESVARDYNLDESVGLIAEAG